MLIFIYNHFTHQTHLHNKQWFELDLNWNTFTDLVFFTLFNQKMAFENFMRGKKCKTLSGGSNS